LFVNPSKGWEVDQRSQLRARIEEGVPNQETPHIGIAYLLAAAKRDGLRARYVDMVMDRYSADKLLALIGRVRPALVGFTALTVQIRTAAALAQRIKNDFPEVKTCVGGPHVIALPRETLAEFPQFDFAVCGEGEDILVSVLGSLDDPRALSKIGGVVVPGMEAILVKRIMDLDALPFPAWEEFHLSNYRGTYPHRTACELPMVSGRGCPYRCVFCCRSLGERIRHRRVASVIAEIERNIRDFGCTSIVFLDETFIVSMPWFERFLTVMMERGLHKKITWSCSTRVDSMSPALLKRMRKAGCYFIFYGIESANDQTLKRIKKNITVAQIKNTLAWTKAAGILPVGAFIIGLPGDTEEDILKAIDLAQELEMYSVTFPVATPFPGTELRALASKGAYRMRLLSNDWDLYGKQEPGVLESDDLPWGRRNALQRLAYERNPKKKIDDYLRYLAGRR